MCCRGRTASATMGRMVHSSGTAWIGRWPSAPRSWAFALDVTPSDGVRFVQLTSPPIAMLYLDWHRLGQVSDMAPVPFADCTWSSTTLPKAETTFFVGRAGRRPAAGRSRRHLRQDHRP